MRQDSMHYVNNCQTTYERQTWHIEVKASIVSYEYKRVDKVTIGDDVVKYHFGQRARICRHLI